MTPALLVLAACTWVAVECMLRSFHLWLLDHAHESIAAAEMEVLADERRWADPMPGAQPVRCFATADAGLVVEFYGSPGPDFGGMR